jgi:hypothetical protein
MATKQQIKKDTATSEPGEQATAILAYQLWLDRGCPVGSPEEDWFRAEQTLRASEESPAIPAVEPRVMRAN